MLPDSIAKRDLLWAKHKTPPDYGGIGEEFLKAGCLSDALEFFARAADRLKVGEVLKASLREGDASVVARIGAVMPDLVTAEVWKTCALEAERLEKWSFARAAWLKAGDAAKAGAAQEKVLKALGYTVAKAPPHEGSAEGNR